MTVLVAIDFSRQSRKALDWAIDYAVARNEDMVVAHAFAGSRTALGVKDGHLDPIGQVEAEMNMGDAVELTGKWSQDARDAGIEVTTVAEKAKPADFILEQAQKAHATIIVIGSRGHGALKRTLLGSVATKVAAEATCPVVVIPPSED